MNSCEMELAEYLKSMLEGTATVRFRVWFNKNGAGAKTILTTPEFSRLKFTPVRFAAEYLKKRNVAYTASHSAVDREEFLLVFPESCTDESGNLVLDKIALLYDGLFGAFLRGELTGATAYIARLWDASKVAEHGFLSEDLRELIWFAETMARIHKDFSRFVSAVLMQMQQASSYRLRFQEITQLGGQIEAAQPLP